MPHQRAHEFWTRLFATAGVLVAYSLGTNVPLPGLDHDKLPALLDAPAAIARLSILALGIMPLLNARLLVEGLTLVAPGVRTWEAASPRNGRRMGFIVASLALLMALLQAAGIASALEDMTGLVVDPGPAFQLTCIATLIAGAAIAMAAADAIDRIGLGSGLWLIFLTPAVLELPRLMAGLALVYVDGTYSTQAVILSVVFTLLAVGGVVRLVWAARAARATVTICLWTPFLASIITMWVLLAAGLMATGNVEVAAAFASPEQPLSYAMLAAFVAVCVWLYARSFARIHQDIAIPAAPIAATLAAILFGAGMLSIGFGVVLPLGSVQLIVAATVITRMILEWRASVPSSQAEADEAAQSSV